MQSNIKVLLVEDNLLAQKVATLILTNLGCELQLAVDGETAIQLFQENSYDIIFMDIGLPRISGLEAAQEIRKLEMSLVHVPIVALTANYDCTAATICLEAGMNDFILKPLSKLKASTILTKFLSKELVNV